MENKEQQVEKIMNGLTGPIRIGQKYYFVGIPYAVVAKVKAVEEEYVVFEPGALFVHSAGQDGESLKNILLGKKNPESTDTLPNISMMSKGAISLVMEFTK